jgi:hypothetical protein
VGLALPASGGAARSVVIASTRAVTVAGILGDRRVLGAAIGGADGSFSDGDEATIS